MTFKLGDYQFYVMTCRPFSALYILFLQISVLYFPVLSFSVDARQYAAE